MIRTSSKPKMYVIRKYVIAASVAQALKKEVGTPVHEIFVDDKWKEDNLADAIGFQKPPSTQA